MAGHTGVDSFSLKANDDELDRNRATVTITVSAGLGHSSDLSNVMSESISVGIRRIPASVKSAPRADSSHHATNAESVATVLGIASSRPQSVELSLEPDRSGRGTGNASSRVTKSLRSIRNSADSKVDAMPLSLDSLFASNVSEWLPGNQRH